MTSVIIPDPTSTEALLKVIGITLAVVAVLILIIYFMYRVIYKPKKGK